MQFENRGRINFFKVTTEKMKILVYKKKHKIYMGSSITKGIYQKKNIFSRKPSKPIKFSFLMHTSSTHKSGENISTSCIKIVLKNLPKKSSEGKKPRGISSQMTNNVDTNN